MIFSTSHSRSPLISFGSVGGCSWAGRIDVRQGSSTDKCNTGWIFHRSDNSSLYARSPRCSRILKVPYSLGANYLDRRLVRIFLALSITISPILKSGCCLSFHVLLFPWFFLEIISLVDVSFASSERIGLLLDFALHVP